MKGITGLILLLALNAFVFTKAAQLQLVKHYFLDIRTFDFIECVLKKRMERSLGQFALMHVTLTEPALGEDQESVLWTVIRLNNLCVCFFKIKYSI